MPECVARGVYQCTGCDSLYGSSLAALACEDDHDDEPRRRDALEQLGITPASVAASSVDDVD